MRYGVIRSSTTEAKYDFWAIFEPTSSSSTLKVSWCDVHYVAPTSRTTPTLTETPTNMQMVVQDPTSKRIFRHGPVTIPNGQSGWFSFSYQLESATTTVNTPTYVFTGSATTTNAAISGASQNCSQVCTTGPPGDDVKRLYRFLGTYQIDSSRCTPSSSCCCGTGTVTSSKISGVVDKVQYAGTLDGSNGMRKGDSDAVPLLAFPFDDVLLTVPLLVSCSIFPR